MADFFPFFIIIVAGLLFSTGFNRLHLPWVTALILSGIIVGPNGLGLLEPNLVIDFFSAVGLVFVMFMAGLEVNLGSFAKVGKRASFVAMVNGGLPFIAGLSLGYWFGMGPGETLLLAAVMASSSVAVVVPMLENRHLYGRILGKTITASTVLLDIFSVTLFSVFLQQNALGHLPVVVVYICLLLALVFLRITIPWLEAYFEGAGRNRFEQELQLIISVLIGMVALFGLLGLHPVEAGFFAGLILSDSVKDTINRAKLHAVGYGLFIPVFFVTVGTRIDFAGAQAQAGTALLVVSVVAVSVVVKYSSGRWAGRLLGFTKPESSLIGAASISQLSVALAVAFAGYELGLIGQALFTALVLLALVTSLLGPFMIEQTIARLAVDKAKAQAS